MKLIAFIFLCKRETVVKQKKQKVLKDKKQE